MDMIHIVLGPCRGVLFPLTWPGENSARKRVYLPSHRLVGELSHPIELLLHFVFSALTPTGGNIPHYFSQYNGPCSTEAQHKIQSAIFPFPHRKLPTPKNLSHDYIFSNYIYIILFLHLAYICPTACAGMLDQFTAGTHRQRATAVTSSGCAAMQCGKCSKSRVMLKNPGSRWDQIGIYSNARLDDLTPVY